MIWFSLIKGVFDHKLGKKSKKDSPDAQRSLLSEEIGLFRNVLFNRNTIKGYNLNEKIG